MLRGITIAGGKYETISGVLIRLRYWRRNMESRFIFLWQVTECSELCQRHSMIIVEGIMPPPVNVNGNNYPEETINEGSTQDSYDLTILPWQSWNDTINSQREE